MASQQAKDGPTGTKDGPHNACDGSAWTGWTGLGPDSKSNPVHTKYLYYKTFSAIFCLGPDGPDKIDFLYKKINFLFAALLGPDGPDLDQTQKVIRSTLSTYFIRFF